MGGLMINPKIEQEKLVPGIATHSPRDSKLIGWCAAVLFGALLACHSAAEDWVKMRQEMVKAVEFDTYNTRHYLGKDKLNANVIKALAKVPRHLFVPEYSQRDAYLNQPMPIGKGQTISQPFIVALMTDLLEVDESSKVFELGTGSGYQAAILAELVKDVYSIEIVASLGEQAAERLASLGYTNAHVRVGDGFFGWPEQAPFDGIIVTAAGIDIPPALIEQLKPEGKLVIPVGEQFAVQHLLVITKHADGSLTEKSVLPVRFVPITGDH
jgi:protein-L-isoaspartate(D-aspartate) O-methyltransferase